jgi:two-component sensor histidine kinase
MRMTTASDPTAYRATALPAAPPPSVSDEVNHRLANHLQLIAALISVEARDVVDPQLLAVLTRTQHRITAIGQVHRQLYAHAADEVDLGAYLEDLGGQLAQSCAPHRRIIVDAETVPVSGSTASSIGILATELITNACKHAYAPAEPGDVRVTLRRLDDGAYRLTVEDRGRGSAAGSGDAGLGSRLMAAMVTKIGAVMFREDARPGTCFRIDVRL